MKIGIINNSLGNVGSVKSALDFYGYDVRLLDAPAMLGDVQLVVLAGVGTYPAGVSVLRTKGFWEPLDGWVKAGNPLVGICLGMQLFASRGLEEGDHLGFGWIEGNVVKLEGPGVRVPHIGWSPVLAAEREEAAALFRGIRYGHFYYMHSYHFVPKDETFVAARTPVGEISVVAALRKDNLVGVQFHPEKSQGDGLRVLRNMVEGSR